MEHDPLCLTRTRSCRAGDTGTVAMVRADQDAKHHEGIGRIVSITAERIAQAILLQADGSKHGVAYRNAARIARRFGSLLQCVCSDQVEGEQMTSGHDPLCPWHIDRLLGDCQCDLIDEVRVDEIKRHEQEVIDAIETTSAMVRKHTTERIAQAIEKMPDAHHPELSIIDVLVWRSDAARIAREFGALPVDNKPERT